MDPSTSSDEILQSHPWSRFGISKELYEVLAAVFHTLSRRFHFSPDPFQPMPPIASTVLLLPLRLTTHGVESSRAVVEQLKDARLSFSDICTWHSKVTATSSLSLRPLVSRVAATQRFLMHDSDKQFGLSPAEQAMLLYDSDEGIFRLPAATANLLANQRVELLSLREFLKSFGEPEPFSFPQLVSVDRQNNQTATYNASASASASPPGGRSNHGVGSQSKRAPASVSFVEDVDGQDAGAETDLAAQIALDYAKLHATGPVAVNHTPLQSSAGNEMGSHVQMSIVLGPRDKTGDNNASGDYYDDDGGAAAAAAMDPADLLMAEGVAEAEAAAAAAAAGVSVEDQRSSSGQQIAALVEHGSAAFESAAAAREAAAAVDSGQAAALSNFGGTGTSPLSPKKVDLRGQFMREVVDTHNELRARHGAPPVEWDDACASSASLAAARCSTACRVVHGFQKNQRTGEAQGQSIFFHRGEQATPADAARAWYAESAFYDYERGQQQQQDLQTQHSVLHFTQLVWTTSTRVGAALSPCGKYLVANYAPAGNVEGLFVEHVKPPVSASPPTAAAAAPFAPSHYSSANKNEQDLGNEMVAQPSFFSPEPAAPGNCSGGGGGGGINSGSSSRNTLRASPSMMAAAAAAPRGPPPRPFFRDLNERVISVLAVRAACAAYADDKGDAVSRFLVGLDTAESSVPFADDMRAALGKLDFEKSFSLRRAATERARDRNQIFVAELPAVYIVAVAGPRHSSDLVDACDFLCLTDPLRGPRNHPAAYHRGFYRRASMMPPLSELCPDLRKPVLLCGHSFGGAIAEIYLRLFAGEAVRAQGSFLVTFGAPAVHQTYQADQHKVMRFVVEGDFVPSVLSLALPHSIAYAQQSRLIMLKELTGAQSSGVPAPASRQRPLERVWEEAMVGPHEASRYVANVESAAVFIEGRFPPAGTLTDKK